MSREEINIDNSDFSSEYLRTNLRFNMEQVKEIDTLLRKASKGLFLPVKRIFEFYSQNLSLFKKRFKALRQDAEKVNSIQNETTQEKETGSQSLNSTVSGLSNEESEILKNLCASTMNVVGLLNNLFNTSQFDELVKSLPQEIKNLKKEVLSDDENCFKDDEALEKSKKKKFLGKKKKRANSENEKNEKSNENGRTPNKAKSKKKPLSEESEQKEKRYSDEEATEVMKEKFNENFKGITKTFLTRKLTKNITWSSEFDFNIEDPLQNQKEIVKSATYKYTKLTIHLSQTPLDIMDLLKMSFKKYICKLGRERIVVGGEMADELEKFLEIFKENKTIKKFKIVYVKVEVYAFLEELFQEFEIDGENIIQNFSDEEISSLKHDWIFIVEMREAWRSLKGIK